MSSQAVWFQLYDFVEGLPLKATSATRVFVSASAIVDDFRKAVKADHSNKLSSVDAADLQVYRNKAAFDKRNDAGAKEEPLAEDFIIDGLGTSKKDALCVVVPPSVRQSSVQDAKAPYPFFVPSPDPFFNNIASIPEDDGWLHFKENIPETKLKKLFVRDSYRALAESIEPGINKAIITGTPGIGKSLFLFYLLRKLVKEGKRVFIVYGATMFYYDGQGGVFGCSSLPDGFDLLFWNETLWCLFDAKDKTIGDLGKFPYGKCTFVLSTSPRRDLVNDFRKAPTVQEFYMPIWTEEELDVIAPCFPGAIDWRRRYDVLGGVPRLVLENTSKDPVAIIEDACRRCSLDDCMEVIGLSSSIKETSKVVHALVHVTSSYPFTDSSVSFASEVALRTIVRKKWKEAVRDMRILLEACDGNPLSASLCGYIFEPYAIELLEKGGEFRCRQLFHGNKRDLPEEGKLTIPPSKKLTVDRVSEGQTLKQLYVPTSRNYAAIDAWMPGIGGFQMTVGKRHKIKGMAENDLAKLGEAKLYWLLPPMYYDEFKKQTPQTIDQYAVLIPYPEHLPAALAEEAQ